MYTCVECSSSLVDYIREGWKPKDVLDNALWVEDDWLCPNCVDDSNTKDYERRRYEE